MSEEIRLPPGLLPPEKHYRPERQGAGWWFLFVLGVCYVFAYLIFPRGIFASWEILCDLIAMGVILTFAKALWQQKRMQRLATEHTDAVALLGAGKVREASDILDSLCKRKPLALPTHAVFVFCRGVAYLRAGNPDRALSLYAAVLESGGMSGAKGGSSEHYGILLGAIAMVYAVKGEMETAERWQGLAHDHITPARAGLLLLLDVCLGVRSGRHEVVVKDAENHWADAAGILPGAQMQGVRVLCAFALSQKNPNNVRDAEIRRFLDGAWPCQAGQFDYLAVNWPELRTFLEENGLTNKPEAKQQ